MRGPCALLLLNLLLTLSCTPSEYEYCASPIDISADGTSLAVPERSALDPDVVLVDGSFVVYLGSVILGDGALYRTVSTDGVQWTEPVRVFNAYDATVVFHDGQYLMLYTSDFDDGEVIGPRTRFGLATSPDGIEWSDNGIVFSGPAEGDDENTPALEIEGLYRPLLWVENDEFHLLYVGFEPRYVEDMGYSVQVLGYAKGPDLAQLAHVRWLHVPERCLDGGSSEFLVFQRVRAGCVGCGAVHGFITRMRDCESDQSRHELIFPEESQTASRIVIDVASDQGVVVSYPSTSVSFEGSYAEGATTTLRLRRSLFGCEMLE